MKMQTASNTNDIQTITVLSENDTFERISNWSQFSQFNF